MKLLEPIEIGSLKLKNRIVFPAIASAYATTAGFVTDAMIAYYKNIAKNCALCIAEAERVNDFETLTVRI